MIHRRRTISKPGRIVAKIFCEANALKSGTAGGHALKGRPDMQQ